MLLLIAAAYACPTIAVAGTTPLEFDVAQVAIVHENNRTTFSVSVNPSGDPQEFALVLPVPEILGEDEVRTLDPEIFARLDGVSAPRHVDDAGCSPPATCAFGYPTTADSGGVAPNSEVSVEATYLVGDYVVQILSATESDGLATWLDEHDYTLPDGADAMLAEYIDGGSYFLAAKVAPEAELADGRSLAPLQVAYDSDIYAIPIRLATLNSPGEQDMVIYAISDASEGQVAISNYTEFSMADTCVWGVGSAEDFASWYDIQFTDRWNAAGGGAWTMEFAGGPYSCSPCTNTALSAEDVSALGFTGAFDDHFLTRLHFRYTPAQATKELTLYTTNIRDTMVLSFADDLDGNECVDACAEPESASCGLPAPGTGGIFLGVVLALWRRRRVAA